MSTITNMRILGMNSHRPHTRPRPTPLSTPLPILHLVCRCRSLNSHLQDVLISSWVRNKLHKQSVHVFGLQLFFCLKEGLLHPYFTISARARGLLFLRPFLPRSLLVGRRSSIASRQRRPARCWVSREHVRRLCLLRIASHSVTNCDMTT